MTQILIVDNYDSFAYNLVQYVGGAIDAPHDGEVLVRRNDAIDVDGIRRLDPDAIVVSPGPGTPAEAGVSIPIFRELEYPTLGVCLGHQALCAAAGAPVGHAPRVVHGKPSTVTHDGTGVFEGLPDPFEAGRYHSLAVDREALPAELLETASTVLVDGDRAADASEPGPTDAAGREIVMAVRHRDRPHVGVQFHPESILTGAGMTLIENFVDAAANASVVRS